MRNVSSVASRSSHPPRMFDFLWNFGDDGDWQRAWPADCPFFNPPSYVRSNSHRCERAFVLIYWPVSTEIQGKNVFSHSCRICTFGQPTIQSQELVTTEELRRVRASCFAGVARQHGVPRTSKMPKFGSGTGMDYSPPVAARGVGPPGISDGNSWVRANWRRIAVTRSAVFSQWSSS